MEKPGKYENEKALLGKKGDSRKWCVIEGTRTRDFFNYPAIYSGSIRRTQQSNVTYFYSKTNHMHQCLNFILFWNKTLHVSDGLSVHHQEFKTVHTATGICQTEIPEMGKITSECGYML